MAMMIIGRPAGRPAGRQGGARNMRVASGRPGQAAAAPPRGVVARAVTAKMQMRMRQLLRPPASAPRPDGAGGVRARAVAAQAALRRANACARGRGCKRQDAMDYTFPLQQSAAWLPRASPADSHSSPWRYAASGTTSAWRTTSPSPSSCSASTATRSR
eukprot:scaffold3761_cov372-Prasinococcus_capsulatus_cf.AAC.13